MLVLESFLNCFLVELTRGFATGTLLLCRKNSWGNAKAPLAEIPLDQARRLLQSAVMFRFRPRKKRTSTLANVGGWHLTLLGRSSGDGLGGIRGMFGQCGGLENERRGCFRNFRRCLLNFGRRRKWKQGFSALRFFCLTTPVAPGMIMSPNSGMRGGVSAMNLATYRFRRQSGYSPSCVCRIIPIADWRW